MSGTKGNLSLDGKLEVKIIKGPNHPDPTSIQKLNTALKAPFNCLKNWMGGVSEKRGNQE